MKVTEFDINTGKIRNGALLRIVQLSDLHKKVFGPHNRELSDTVRSLKPDIIVITGDMISRSSKNLDNLIPLLKSLSETATVYYSLGNHETDLRDVNFPLLENLLEEVNKYCILLDNQTVHIKSENMDVNMSGLTLPQECYKNNGSYRNLKTVTSDDVQNLLGTNPETESISILLAHNPMFFDAYAEYGSDLILSGHVHGGCIKLPLIGGLLSPERKFFPEYYSGLYKQKNSSMIVSCGLGKLRIFNPPEIVAVNLK